MAETVYDAGPELHRPGRFLAGALADLWHSLPIAWQLFKTILRVKFRRAWLGYIWLLIPAFGTALICTLIQRRVVSLPATPLPYPIFVLSGMIFWQAFVEAVTAPLEQLNTNRQLITRSRLPHEALLISGFLEVMLNFCIRFLVLAILLFYFRIGLRPSIAFVPLGAVSLVMIGAAVGIFAAPLALLYADVEKALGLAITFLFFLTPILYPLPLQGVFRLNPLVILLSTTRSWLISPESPQPFLLCTAAAFAALVFAWLFYRLARPHVIARLG